MSDLHKAARALVHMKLRNVLASASEELLAATQGDLPALTSLGAEARYLGGLKERGAADMRRLADAHPVDFAAAITVACAEINDMRFDVDLPKIRDVSMAVRFARSQTQLALDRQGSLFSQRRNGK